jgi:hypothetical protein
MTARRETALEIRRLRWIMGHVVHLSDAGREWLIDKLIWPRSNMTTANYWIQRRQW